MNTRTIRSRLEVQDAIDLESDACIVTCRKGNDIALFADKQALSQTIGTDLAIAADLFLSTAIVDDDL